MNFPSRDAEKAIESICLARGGWAQAAPPDLGGTVEVAVAGGDRFVVYDDGSYFDDAANRLVVPKEE